MSVESIAAFVARYGEARLDEFLEHYGAALEARAMALLTDTSYAPSLAALLEPVALNVLVCLRADLAYRPRWHRVSRALHAAGLLVPLTPALAAAHRAQDLRWARRRARCLILGLAPWDELPPPPAITA